MCNAMLNIKTDYEFLHYFFIIICNITQSYSMIICLLSTLLGNPRSFVFAGSILIYFADVDQEAAGLSSEPPDQDV